MGSIRVLPQGVADRIAAGEVVERPASVVRELVDNALDAEALRIELDLAAGGTELVSVADDGTGMSEDDALMAFERHATSKIRSGDDLDEIETLGFRGEALAAIAAVSRVVATTRPASAAGATRVVIDRGRLIESGPASRAPGTTFDVHQLFRGIPARRKFLKTVGTEQEHCVRALRRAALARPEVAFRGRHDGRAFLDLPASDEQGRVLALLGDRWGRDLVPVDVTAPPMSLRGWVGRADVHRPTRDGIHVLVNRRPLRDSFLMRAVTDAFRNTLPPGRFPVAVLYLDLPAGEVDVNVHPAKSEVRFQRLREVRALVTGGLSEALGGEGARPHLPGSTTVIAGSHHAPSREGAGPAGDAWELPLGGGARHRVEQAFLASTAGWQKGLGDDLPEMQAPVVRALAQFRDCYILAEDAEGLLIVDQHVAHERYLYEKLLKEAEGGALPRQASLFPAVLEVGPERAEIVEEHRELILRCGFRVEPFGGDSIRVAEVPAVMGRDTRPEAVVTILDQILDGERNFTEPMLNQLLATVACHTAVRKGQALSLEKMDYLLQGLEACEAPHHCPHGRAVSMRVDIASLDRVFGRT